MIPVYICILFGSEVFLQTIGKRRLPGDIFTFRISGPGMEIEKSQKPVMEKKPTNIRTKSMEANATQLTLKKGNHQVVLQDVFDMVLNSEQVV